MKKINISSISEAIGPYSQAILVENLFFTSGQLPLDFKSGTIIGENIREQTIVVLENVGKLLESEGMSFDDVVKTTCYLKNINDFVEFNEVYGNFFTNEPARSLVEVAQIPKGALCEVDIIAVKEGGKI